MPHRSWLGCEPAGALRQLELELGSARSRFKWTVGVQHGVRTRRRCRLCAIFRPPTVAVATRTFTSGARRNGRLGRARRRDAGRSCQCTGTWMPTGTGTLLAEPSLGRLSLGRGTRGAGPRLSSGFKLRAREDTVTAANASHRPMKAASGD